MYLTFMGRNGSHNMRGTVEAHFHHAADAVTNATHRDWFTPAVEVTEEQAESIGETFAKGGGYVCWCDPAPAKEG